ncbi:BTAD domain-containing putative transcriptional regulator [Umezawaea endophytica]|uniref:Winged helix-turn-helix domain-containing protein n=1 Tax=Umezawaea endophytica TaxID=1654476 RepID=A0A9X3AH15_9PSEU|nr:BTAD domain-containing putative transcriptional regulator [Umezawaea endophytica]MCS7480361.1 winged helix-turn-helix domain-containing protein [Umezawaea endophytica]
MEFRILGPLEARSGERPVRVGGARQQRLLALLLLSVNRVVPVERLVDELWDAAPRSARQQIHNAVASLRRTLSQHTNDVGIRWIEVGYRLDAPEASIDVNRFLGLLDEARQAEAGQRWPEAVAALRVALDLWRGDVLAGLGGATIENAATRLHEQRLTAVEDLMSLRLRTGETGSAVGELRQLVTEHPLRDSLRISLIRALHRSGRQADALAVYDDGRRMLAEDLGLDPSPELQRIHADVLRGTAEPAPIATPSEPGGDSPDRGRTRSSLPYDTNDFSGRSAELARLRAATSGTSATAITISAVDGMGGVGKTTLAIHLAHEVAANYPDGHYFVDLHGFTAGMSPVPPEQALDVLLSASGVAPELIPSTVEGRSALWRSEMAGKRILLVIDNAVNAAHVRLLLPGAAGALVMVTSRRKLTALEGALPLSLDVLPLEDGVTLFAKVAGAERAAAEPDAVATAVELCGRLPLAIRIAAARFRDRAGWTVGELVNRLRNHAQRVRFLEVDDRGVMAALRVSYRYLPPARQRLFRLLSLHPGGDFDACGTAALTGLPLDEVEQHLDSLFDDNLLKQNTTGRFYFHDLVRDCARQLLTEEADDAAERTALGRLLDYYLHAAHTWCGHHHNAIYGDAPLVDHVPEHLPVPSTAQKAVAILDVEYDNLTAVARFAAENGWHRHAWQLVCALQPLLKLHNYGGRSYDLFEAGARAALASGDVRGESACLQGLAAVCRDHRSTAEARKHIERALDLSRRIGATDSETAQLIDLGNLYLHEDRLLQARTIFQQAEPLTERGSTTFPSLAVANNLGVICGDLGDFEEALVHLRRAEALVTKEDTRSAQFISWSTGSVLHAMGAHEEARREFTRGLEMSTASGSSHGEAFALLGLCGVNRSSGHLAESLDQGRRALTTARRFELHVVECEVMNCLGETALALRDVDRAERTFELARDVADRFGIARYRARALEGLAHVAFRRGQRAEARQYWEQAAATYPTGMVDVEYARHHLAALDDEAAVCFRCAVSGKPLSARRG